MAVSEMHSDARRCFHLLTRPWLESLPYRELMISAGDRICHSNRLVFDQQWLLESIEQAYGRGARDLKLRASLSFLILS